MSRDRKRQLSWYQVDDTEAVARRLEKMAGRGWLLEEVDNWFFTYRRGEPAQVRYAVTFFPDASVYDPGLTEGQETYAAYCRAAGWELAAAYGPVQYFRSTRPDPLPIETDEAVKLTAIRRTMRKTSVVSYALLLVMFLLYLPLCWMELRRSPMEFFSRNQSLALVIIAAGGLLFSGGMLVDYLLWVLRSKRSTARGGPCAKPHTRFRRWFSGVIIAVFLFTLLLMAADASFDGQLVYMALHTMIFAGILLLARQLLRLMKRKGVRRGTARGLSILFAVAAGVAMGFLMPVIFAGLADAGVVRMGREPAETYTKTYENTSWTYTRDVFYDDLPVTLEDLGYAVTPEDRCTYEAEIRRSPLAVHSAYLQEAYSSDSDLPRLYYQTFETGWPWLLEGAWEGLLANEREDEPWLTQALEPAPWGAEEAYRKESDAYFLLYPDRIVTFCLSGDDASPERLEAIVQALWP